MKNLILILILSAGSFSMASAQNDNREQKTEKVQALKIAFITQKLELTSEEAQRFWPVYNRYETDIRQVMTENKLSGDAIDNEEITQGARCIGVPIFNMFGHVEGAISLSGAKHRFPNEEIPTIAAVVKEVGRTISQKLGYIQLL